MPDATGQRLCTIARHGTGTGWGQGTETVLTNTAAHRTVEHMPDGRGHRPKTHGQGQGIANGKGQREALHRAREWPRNSGKPGQGLEGADGHIP